MKLSIGVTDVGHTAIVECNGGLDASTKDELIERIREALVPGRQLLLLDLSSLAFADSTALDILRSAYTMTRAEGVALEVQAGRAIQRVIDLFGPPYIS